MTTSTAAGPVTIEFPALLNEQGIPMLWLASWLVGSTGTEGAWFYSGRGGEAVTVRPPAGSSAIRVRRWISDGLPPEYADHPVDRHIAAARLDFDEWRGFRRTGEAVRPPTATETQHSRGERLC